MTTERISWKETGWNGRAHGPGAPPLDSIAIFPLKIIVIFFHELSHGLPPCSPADPSQEISVSSREGGYCLTLGGSPFLILSAGYLGSLFWAG